MNHKKTDTVLSFVLILIFMAVWFTMAYSTMPFGDDVGMATFENAISFYLDGVPNEVGPKMTSLSQVLHETAHNYVIWTGRITSNIPYFMNGILGETSKSLIAAFIFGGICFLVARLIYGSAKESMQHPLALCLLCALLFWYIVNMDYMFMWTMTAVYGFTMLYYFTYLNMTQDLETCRYQCGIGRLIFFNLLGLLAGLSHELIGIVFISMILYRTLREIIAKRIPWHKIFYHSGLGIAYCFCFFSPGNFNRLIQSHENYIRTNSLLYRILVSGWRHLSMLIKEEPGGWHIIQEKPIGLIIFCILIILFVISNCLRLRKQKAALVLEDFWDCNGSYICGYVISIIAWGIVPSCPSYAVTYSKALVLIVLFNGIKNISAHLSVSLKRWCAILVVSLLLAGNAGWIYNYAQITNERRILIAQAVANQESEVMLPRYPESLAPSLVMLPYLNADMIDEPYLTYYGTSIIIEP